MKIGIVSMFMVFSLALSPMVAIASDPDSTSEVIKKSAPPGIAESFYRCIDAASGSMIEEASCLASEKDAQDARLNKNYRELLGVLKADAKDALIVSEKSWLDSRKKDGALEMKIYGDDSSIDSLQLEQNDIFRICLRANLLKRYKKLQDLTN